ncbi:alginate lyase family protein [Litorimonas sp.]|uniref:alginate lyase family protein n=1 Tax=Litorimonas sp. TaxID=1892381 RepID=UPI003A86D611
MKPLILSLFLSALASSAMAQSETTKTDPDISKTCSSTSSETPVLFIWDARDLAFTREKIANGNKTLKPAFDALMKEADAALEKGPYSVMHKTKTPPSGNKHDYYSIGPYWWPDPKKKDGLPYKRKDGETNPERYDDSFDKVQISNFMDDVETLSLAAYFTGNKAYAEHAAKLVKAWFLNPSTRMNPNLNFAQAIPGKTDGRGIGIIDSYGFVKVIDSIGLLNHAGTLTSQEIDALKEWFSEYALWMLTSDNGKEERAATNNHGVYYDAQLMAFSAFAGDMKAVKFFADGIKSSRIPGQINKKGQLPLELKRTRPFHYTAYTLNAFFDAADVAECVGINIWDYETPKSQSLKDAILYQAQYAYNLQAWPFKEIRDLNPRGLYHNLLRADYVYDENIIDSGIASLDGKYESDPANLTYPTGSRLLHPNE